MLSNVQQECIAQMKKSLKNTRTNYEHLSLSLTVHIETHLKVSKQNEKKR